ncbi:hypothetical protein B0H14DRAFT_2784064, partial [Mycena olivaceomarginata]
CTYYLLHLLLLPLFLIHCRYYQFGTNIPGNGSNYADTHFEIPTIRTYTIDAGVAASASASAAPQTTGSASGSATADGVNQTQVTTTGGAGRTNQPFIPCSYMFVYV